MKIRTLQLDNGISIDTHYVFGVSYQATIDAFTAAARWHNLDPLMTKAILQSAKSHMLAMDDVLWGSTFSTASRPPGAEAESRSKYLRFIAETTIEIIDRMISQVTETDEVCDAWDGDAESFVEGVEESLRDLEIEPWSQATFPATHIAAMALLTVMEYREIKTTGSWQAACDHVLLPSPAIESFLLEAELLERRRQEGRLDTVEFQEPIATISHLDSFDFAVVNALGEISSEHKQAMRGLKHHVLPLTLQHVSRIIQAAYDPEFRSSTEGLLLTEVDEIKESLWESLAVLESTRSDLPSIEFLRTYAVEEYDHVIQAFAARHADRALAAAVPEENARTIVRPKLGGF